MKIPYKEKKERFCYLDCQQNFNVNDEIILLSIFLEILLSGTEIT